MMTDDDLKKISDRVATASKGPWVVETTAGNSGDKGMSPEWCIETEDGFGVALPWPYANLRTALKWKEQNSRQDAEFIAHARQDIPALLAALAETRAELDKIRASYEDLCAMQDERD